VVRSLKDRILPELDFIKEKEMERVNAVLDWSLNVECPKCKQDIDLAKVERNEDGQYSRAIFNNKWHDLEGEEVECSCGNIFKIKEVEY
jgi:hypothetical protein